MLVIENLLIFIGGLLCIFASIYDWDWFFENARASLFVWLFGREGARRFYFGLGCFLIFTALYLMRFV